MMDGVDKMFVATSRCVALSASTNAGSEIDVPGMVKIGPIIPPIPLFVSISGSIGAELDLAFGYDTHGIEKAQETGDWYDVYAGLFISDRENPDGTATETRSLQGRWVTPALIDCHTHLVFAGDRAAEFEMRLRGASYEDIAREGGGIMTTVRATRAASEDELFTLSKPRLTALMQEGVATVEIKSGYGLDTDSELKMLRVARRLGREMPVEVRTSLLAAHTVPPEFKSDPDAYIDLICDEILPRAVSEELVDAVDAYCETVAFSGP